MSDAPTVLSCPTVTTEDALRKRIARLVELGVTQKSLAATMGVSETWLSRWINKTNESHITVDAMDRFNRFAAALADVASGQEGLTQKAG